MQIGMNIGSHTLQLFGLSASSTGPSQTNTDVKSVSDVASRYVPGEAERSDFLSGIYSDPRLSARAEPELRLADKAVAAFQNVLANELSDYKADARSKLEAELGRSLGENESFTSLSSVERSTLSKDVYFANNDARLAEAFLSLASAQPGQFGATNLAASDDEVFDIGTEEGRNAAIDEALNAIVDLQMGGIAGAQSNGGIGAELASVALSEAGVINKDELRASFYEQQKSRFESNELILSYRGQALN